MPKPVLSKTEAITGTPILTQQPVGDLTHKVTLVNGKTVSILDNKRPGSPWIFKEGETVRVPEYIAQRLKAKSIDAVTVKVGNKVSGRNEQKFRIEKIGAAGSEPEEEETGEDGAHLREG